MRFETRGSIEDYFRAAAAHAAPGARFITVYPTPYTGRLLEAAQANGFSVRRSIDIIPRAGKPSLFTLFCCVNDNSAAGSTAEALVVRGEDRLFTPEFRSVRRMLAFPDKAK